MQKLIRSHLLFSFSNMKYIIRDNKYLIEAPPEKPLSGYLLYIKQSTTGLKNTKGTQNIVEFSKKWTQDQAIKEKYENQAKKSYEEYQQLFQKYQLKYPLKRVTYVSLVTSQFYKTNINKDTKVPELKNIQDYAKQTAQKIKNTEVMEKMQLLNKVQNINYDNKKKLEQYIIPARKYATYEEFIKKFKKNFGKNEMVNTKAIYDIHNNKWKNQVENWLKEKGYQLTIEQFVQLYNTQTKEKAKKKQREEEKAYFKQLIKQSEGKNANNQPSTEQTNSVGVKQQKTQETKQQTQSTK